MQSSAYGPVPMNALAGSESIKRLSFQLADALAQLGIENHHNDSMEKFLSLDEGFPDSLVAALRCRVLSDDNLAEQVSDVLLHYSADTLAKGTKTPEDKLLRLELLMLAVPSATRGQLMTAVKADLAHHSNCVSEHLERAGNDLVFIAQVTIGGGPQGQTIANHAHELGVGGANLVVDASSAGDGNFGSVRHHLLNSATGAGFTFPGQVPRSDAERSRNPIYGGPIQVEDLNPTSGYPTAGDIGDAATLGLYAASVKGTPVLVNTTVTKVEEVAGHAGRYLVSMEDTKGKKSQVLTDQIIDATGLGKPSVPIKDKASHKYINQQTARCISGATLHDQAVMHSEDMLRASCHAPDEDILDIIRKSPGNITLVGWGDSAKTPLLRIKEVADKHALSMDQLLGDRKIHWIGPKDADDVKSGLWGPYSDLQPYFDRGLIKTMPVRLETIAPGADGCKSTITFRSPEGTGQLESGRVILAMGMKSGSAEVLRAIAPDANATMRKTVYGHAPIFGDGPVCTQLKTGETEHPIYFAGVASGIKRPADTSYLEYFGVKSRLLMEQCLLPKLKSRPDRPFESVVPLRANSTADRVATATTAA